MNKNISKDKKLNMDSFYGGYNNELYKFLGTHFAKKNGLEGVIFRLWAPNAKNINVSISDKKIKTIHKLKKINESIWEIFIPNLKKNTKYKYLIETENGKIQTKSDPFSFFSAQHPFFDSIIYDLENFKWSDENFIQNRKEINALDKAILIYEIHLGSWKKTLDNTFLNYKDFADFLVNYLKKMSYTHVEFMPLFEHPFLGSWGYQITGYFSPTSRYGKPEELKYLINKLHKNNIGVILDFVPIHYCKDEHGLINFDGTNLYSYENPNDRENYGWGTQNFNLSKNEIKSFFTSVLFYWIEIFHIDGFRFDAVSHLIHYGGLERRGIFHEGINFAKHLISLVKKDHPNVLMIAEDSSFFPNVTGEDFSKSLGFNLKWDLGFSNDLFEFIKKPYWERSYENFDKLTFSMAYFYNEKYLLAFSHDEVVHLKKSLLNKPFGFIDKKFSQIRLMFLFLITHPGKKLIFMGNDFAQFDEWNEKKSLDWHLLENDKYNLENKNVNKFNKELFKIYKKNKPLYELDFDEKAFKWIHLDKKNSIWVFARFSLDPKDFYIIVLNFSINYFSEYIINNIPKAFSYQEIINSDDLKFSGTGAINNLNLKMTNDFLKVKIAPLSGFILKPIFKDKKGVNNE